MAPDLERVEYLRKNMPEIFQNLNKKIDVMDKDISRLNKCQIQMKSPLGSTPCDFRMKLDEIRMVYNDPAKHDRLMSGEGILHDQIVAECNVLFKALKRENRLNTLYQGCQIDPVPSIDNHCSYVECDIRDFAKFQREKHDRRPRKSAAYFESQLNEIKKHKAYSNLSRLNGSYEYIRRQMSLISRAIRTERYWVLEGKDLVIPPEVLPKDYESQSLIYDWSIYDKPPPPYSKET